MDLLDAVKQFINESIQSLFTKQKEDLSLIIRKETTSAVSELKIFGSQQIQANERDIANMQQNIFSLNQKMQTLLEKIDSMQDSFCQRRVSDHEAPFREGSASPMHSVPRETVYYAKMVDSMNPLGFVVENLKTTDEGCAFKITLTDGKEGHYAIIDDPDIQQEMLAAFNPLISDSSSFDEVPQNPTKIEIVSEGSLAKEDHLLRITNKQKIKFY